MLYRVIKTADETVVATVGVPYWIKRLPNGYLGICSEEEAQGVAVYCEPYHLEGRKGLSELETVKLVRITEQEYEEEIILKQQELLDIVSGEVTIDENTDES